MSETSILVLLGSLRAASSNRLLAEAAVDAAASDVTVTVFEGLSEIPFYNEDIDIEGDVPAAAVKLRDAIAAADAVLLITPEHNGTIPAVLKNAIDWSSRPFGVGSIVAKPVAVIGGAYGQFGGIWAQDEARKALGIAGASVLGDLTLSIADSAGRFTPQHPRDDEEIMTKLGAVIAGVTAAAQAA
jgi:NAD(P)H-dependent FMN reductase